MLAHIRVRDLALIDALDISLSPAFNVLTGETGAGKSLVAAAIDLLLGRRASGELVRRGSKEAEVEGLFDISDEPEVKARLEGAGIPADDELLIRRVIPLNGRHKCYVNGHIASLTMLSELADGLARVTSQHEQHALMDGASRMALLDGFGGLAETGARMAALFGRLGEAEEALAGLKSREQDRAGRLDYLKYQLEEIERIAPQPGELNALDTEIDRLRHQEELVAAAAFASEELYERESAIFDRLNTVAAKVEEAAVHDPSISGSAEALREAAALVEDAARTLSKYGHGIDSDPAYLEEREERAEALRQLMRKHGTDLEGVLTVGRHMTEELTTLESYDEALQNAEAVAAEARKAATAHAAKLSSERKRAGRALAKAVIKELKDLMFSEAGFEVALSPSPRGLSASGADSIEFLVALNPGEGTHPLSKVASGGELSRLMLAVKRAMAGVGPVGTYIFDEVDAGIGGPVASSVGRKLKEVAAHHQVICITHLPQIAGMADRHFFVSKSAEGGRTRTNIDRLETEARVEELARMLAGDQVTDKTRAAAVELIR